MEQEKSLTWSVPRGGSHVNKGAENAQRILFPTVGAVNGIPGPTPVGRLQASRFSHFEFSVLDFRRVKLVQD